MGGTSFIVLAPFPIAAARARSRRCPVTPNRWTVRLGAEAAAISLGVAKGASSVEALDECLDVRKRVTSGLDKLAVNRELLEVTHLSTAAGQAVNNVGHVAELKPAKRIAAFRVDWYAAEMAGGKARGKGWERGWVTCWR